MTRKDLSGSQHDNEEFAWLAALLLNQRDPCVCKAFTAFIRIPGRYEASLPSRYIYEHRYFFVNLEITFSRQQDLNQLETRTVVGFLHYSKHMSEGAIRESNHFPNIPPRNRIWAPETGMLTLALSLCNRASGSLHGFPSLM